MGVEAADILAGPIVRRVEPTLAAVWLALRKPVAVRLELFRGVGPRTALVAVPGRIVAAPPTQPRGLPPDPHTLAIGAELHIAVAVFEPEPPSRLAWGTIYSYDVRLTADGGGDEVGFDELGLLRSHTFEGWFGPQASLALGYQDGWLPSFVLPAARPLELRLTQGSCRWSNGLGRDALPIVDDLLSAHLGDPTMRLQQLWLTGDQIYADAGAPEFVRAATAIGTRLLDGGDRVIEQIAVPDPDDPARPFAAPMDQLHFPAGRRDVLVNLVAGLTSSKQDSHAIGFGEYAATYLAAWHTAVWPDLQAMMRARWDEVTSFVAARDALDRYAAGFFGMVPRPTHFDKMCDLYEAWRLLPGTGVAIDAHLTEDDRWEQWDEIPSEPTKAPWKTFWERAAALVPAMTTRFTAYAQPPGPPSAVVPASPVARTLARTLTPSWWAGDRTFQVTREGHEAAPSGVVGDAARERLHRLQHFREDIPRVRRALANIATYTTFDDHEVCDDWNITAGWVTKVRGNALGRNILRNGLAAYTVFQGWGNDPRAFVDPHGPGQQVLRLIASMFVDETGAGRIAGPPTAVADELDLRFNNRPLTDPEPTTAERIRWDYRYDGPGYEFLALDSRTRRGYERDADPTIGQPFTNEANAPLLTEEALDEQIPVDPAGTVGDDGLCFVIAAAPVLGYPPVESIAQPLLNINDMAAPTPRGRWAAIRKADRFGRVKYDPEHWGLMPALFERVLARLSSRRCVLFLSGDVHYSCTLAMTYWRKAEGGSYRTSRFIQLTSSSLRTSDASAQLFAVDLAQQLSAVLAAPIERVGWHKGIVGGPGGEAPVSPPASGPQTRFNDRVRYQLQRDPIVLAPSALPANTRQHRAPDWAYRRELLEDPRPDDERLAGLLPPLLLPTSAGWPQMAQSVATRMAWQAEHVPDRRWVWWTNVTTIDFAVVDGVPAVRHSIHTYELADPRSPAKPYVIATAPLVATAADEMPSIPSVDHRVPEES